jgi:hypothetical protein
MFALLSSRFRRLLIFMIAVPLGGRALEALGQRIERSSGPTRLTRSLQAGGRAAGRYSRGPLRPRQASRVAAEADGQSMNGSGPHAGRGSRRRSRR